MARLVSNRPLHSLPQASLWALALHYLQHQSHIRRNQIKSFAVCNCQWFSDDFHVFPEPEAIICTDTATVHLFAFLCICIFSSGLKLLVGLPSYAPMLPTLSTAARSAYLQIPQAEPSQTWKNCKELRQTNLSFYTLEYHFNRSFPDGNVCTVHK